MIDRGTVAIVQGIIRRESRSFLAYLGDSLPWPNIKDTQKSATLEEMIAQERKATADLGRLLTRHRIALPYLGAFPANFTTSNFVSLKFLTPLLLNEQRRAIANLENDMAALDDAETRTAVANLLETKRRHLSDLGEAPSTAT